jgi:hypothetical protein
MPQSLAHGLKLRTHYREYVVVDVDSFSAFTFLCDKRPYSLPESVSTLSLSLWERAGGEGAGWG